MAYGTATVRPHLWGHIRKKIEALQLNEAVEFEKKDRNTAVTSTQRVAEHHRYMRAYRNLTTSEGKTKVIRIK
jgi:hypothetical protein